MTGPVDRPAVIEMHDLRRDFVVRTRRAGLRREKRIVAALNGLTATIRAGEACGYIGANGAGKSTTIKLLTGILVPSAGSARTCGLDPVPNRRALARDLGVVFGQRSQLWWDLPVGESFTILAAIHSVPAAQARDRIDELVDGLQIRPYLSTPVRQLSLGERMRAEVAAALVHRPKLLILDEPTIGLDMISKHRLREFLVRERREHGTTLLLATHDLADVEQLCERVLVIDHGQVAYDGTLADMVAQATLPRILVIDLHQPHAPLQVSSARTVSTELDGMRQRLAFLPHSTTAAAVLAEVAEQVEVRDLRLEEPAIEHVVRSLYERAAPPAGIPNQRAGSGH
ncbi:MAG TPA: ATP-binding cassette domain-containing protein [Micromonosporaceae bacterium]